MVVFPPAIPEGLMGTARSLQPEQEACTRTVKVSISAIANVNEYGFTKGLR